MITDNNRKISVIAYYLSKFDRDALSALGYDTFSTAFSELSKPFGKTNNYMKLRRDEFDAIVSTTRQGWNKRNPTPGVLLIHDDLKNFTFDELTDIVNALIADEQSEQEKLTVSESDKKIITAESESDFESIINSTDPSATVVKTQGVSNRRIYDRKIPDGLKRLYKYRCQICGATATVMYGVDVSEAHHIDYFTKSFNNNPNNIIILCPDHHRIVHKAHAVFDYNRHIFTYDNAKIDGLLYNLHLK